MNSQQQSVTRIAFKTLIVLASLGCVTGAFFIRRTQAIATLTVRNTNDSGPGSFRQAIIDANLFKGVDIINFDIPGSGVQTIRPLSPLPTIRDTVFIDGWSQGGSDYTGPPLIEISGVNVTTPNIPGLRIGCFLGCGGDEFDTVDDSTVRGLIINGFPGPFDPTSLFQADGIYIFGSHNAVKGCYIGTTADGETALPNGGSGIKIHIFGDNDLGGTTRGARNVISGNLQDGIDISLAFNNRIRGNYIGLSASGLSDVGNALNGIRLRGSDNVIGGISTGTRNVISGNNGDGILFYDNSGLPGPLTNNRIEGNYIGTKADGISGGVGNGGWGINTTTNFIQDNRIGGFTSQFGNVISGNGSGRGDGGGIRIFAATRFTVQSNLIGVGADRTTNIGNFGDGIYLYSNHNQIGGSFTYLDFSRSSGNIIAFNQGIGIHVTPLIEDDQNLISRNSIHSNAGLGIDLEPLGVTGNDFCDLDTGPNNLQNFPTITSIEAAKGGGITINGRVNGLLANYTIEFFDNDDCDPSGNGEGHRFLGSTMTTTQLSFCRSLFEVTFPNIPIGHVHFVAATATSPEGDTSEFSPCFSLN